VVLRASPEDQVFVTASTRLPQRPTFTTTGTLGSLAWSPDGSRLLVHWRETDQWLLLLPSARAASTQRARITAIAGISRRFGGTPNVQGWCCA
jgi:hypothetical protein